MRTQSCSEAVLIKDIAAELQRHGLSLHDRNCDIVLPDAESDADLDAIARRYAHEPAPLWCGAAGLARALAQRPPRTGRPLGAPHLVIIGSRHPVSLRQIEVTAAARPEWFAPLTASGFEARVQTTLEARGRCIVLPALPPGLSEMEAIERIARGVERLAERLPPPAALTVIGGETFAAVCRVLRATWLSVDGEFLPGIPASRMESGLWRGTVCASKSGAFGEPDWLLNHLA